MRLLFAFLAMFTTCLLFAQEGAHRAAIERRALPAQERPNASGSQNEEREEVLKRQRWFYGQRAYPNKRIPPNARLRALQELDRRQHTTGRTGMAAAAGSSAAAVAPFGPLWTPMGPAPIGTIDPWTGRVTAISADPSASSTVLIGTSTGGVWRTTDAGKSWTPLTDNQPSLAIGALARDPNQPNTIYAGTGDGYDAGDSYWGAGILKSTDGGNSWTQLPGPFINPNEGGLHIGGIAIGKDSKVILAAVSSNAGTSLEGIYRSTDGAGSFTQVLAGAEGDDVIFDPTNPLIVYASLGESFGSTKNGVYRSDDGGLTWTKSSGAGADILPTRRLARVSLAMAPSNPQVLYAGIADTRSDDLLGMYKTVDGGKNWTKLNAPNYCSGQCSFDNVLRVHPQNPDYVIAGGSAYGDQQNSYLIGSIDGGVTWKHIDTQPDGSPTLHPDHHALEFSADGSVLYDGNDGGIWSTTRTSSLPDSWTNLNAGIGSVLFNPGFSFTAADPNFGYAGTQDNDTIRFRGGTNWDQLAICGDGGWQTLDSTFTSQAVSACHLGIVRRAPSAVWYEADFGIDPNDNASFYEPLAGDPSNTARLYYGTSRVWRSDDGAGTWRAISSDLTQNSDPFVSYISAVGVSPTDPNVVWVGTGDGNVVFSGNALSANPTWSSPAAGIPNRYVTQVAPDPFNTQAAIATASGFTSGSDKLGHVFRTTTGGSAWQDISGDLPNIPANDIIIDPDQPNTYYLATDIGVFQTTNAGVNWVSMNNGLPRVVVQGLSLHRPSRLLRAGTYGRSMWQVNLPVTQSLAPSITRATPSMLNAGTTQQTVAIAGTNFTSSSVVRWNGVARQSTFLNPASLSVSIPATDLGATGRATLTVVNPASPGGLSNPVNIDIGPAPAVPANGVVSTASGVGGAVSPGSIVAVYGSNLASGLISETTSWLPFTLGSATVLFDGNPAGLYFVSPGQVNVQVPWEVPDGFNTVLTVYTGTMKSAAVRLRVANFVPGLYTVNQRGSGQGSILISGTATVAAPVGLLPNSKPAKRGGYIEIYGTGFGPVDNTPYDGAPPSALATATTTPVVTVGGVPAKVLFCGLTPNTIGLYQINIQIPDAIAPGDAVPIVVTQSGIAANTVTVAVQ